MLIGERPGGSWPQTPVGPDALTLADAGVTTFVSLIGEYSSERYRERDSHPSGLRRAARDADFLHFPVADFQPAEQQPLESLVLELKRRVVAGEVIYIHCRGGHGRTGTVAIPLIAGLFDLENDRAQECVRAASRANRPNENPKWGVHMPETAGQVQAAVAANAKARGRARR